MAFPGTATTLDAARQAGRTAAQVMAGVVLMLVVAGLLESFARQLVEPTPARFAIGGAMLALWLAYFTFSGRRAGALR
jgi:uncharacterized membrane protein SpoIIM required for sporulation